MPTPGLRPLPNPNDRRAVAEHLIYQTDYYLSATNLMRDKYLLSHMDKDGFVEIGLIATFNRINYYVDHQNLASFMKVRTCFCIAICKLINDLICN